MKVRWRRVRVGIVLAFHLLAIVGQGKKSFSCWGSKGSCYVLRSFERRSVVVCESSPFRASPLHLKEGFLSFQTTR